MGWAGTGTGQVGSNIVYKAYIDVRFLMQKTRHSSIDDLRINFMIFSVTNVRFLGKKPAIHEFMICG